MDIDARINELVPDISPEVRAAVVKACTPYIFLYEDTQEESQLEIRWQHQVHDLVVFINVNTGKIVEEYAVENDGLYMIEICP